MVTNSAGRDQTPTPRRPEGQGGEVSQHKLRFKVIPVSPIIHPGRLTWNLPITHLERKMIFQTSMIMFHVNLQGCTPNVQFTFFGNDDSSAPFAKNKHILKKTSILGGSMLVFGDALVPMELIAPQTAGRQQFMVHRCSMPSSPLCVPNITLHLLVT